MKNARELVPCMHCPTELRGKTRVSKGYTGFVRFHPFKPGWEIRKCFTCGKLTAQDSRS